MKIMTLITLILITTPNRFRQDHEDHKQLLVITTVLRKVEGGEKTHHHHPPITEGRKDLNYIRRDI